MHGLSILKGFVICLLFCIMYVGGRIGRNGGDVGKFVGGAGDGKKKARGKKLVKDDYVHTFVYEKTGESRFYELRKLLMEYVAAPHSWVMVNNSALEGEFMDYSMVRYDKQGRNMNVKLLHQLGNINPIRDKFKLYFGLGEGSKYFPKSYDLWEVGDVLPEKKVYIAKPADRDAWGGKDIYVVASDEDLVFVKRELKGYERVLFSEYIADPLLWGEGKRKFHIRLYYIFAIIAVGDGKYKKTLRHLGRRGDFYCWQNV